MKFLKDMKGESVMGWAHPLFGSLACLADLARFNSIAVGDLA